MINFLYLIKYFNHKKLIINYLNKKLYMLRHRFFVTKKLDLFYLFKLNNYLIFYLT